MMPSKKGVTFDFCEICSVDAAICNVLSLTRSSSRSCHIRPRQQSLAPVPRWALMYIGGPGELSYSLPY